MIIERLKKIRCFLLDMDGTFFLGNRLLPGAKEWITYLEQCSIPFLFLTNNSSRSPHEYAEKIRRLGVNIPDNAIYTSGEATAHYLHRKKPGARVYVVGTASLENEFKAHGFVLDDQAPEAVVLGFDTGFTYEKLRKLCDFVSAGLSYIATHPDINCPVEGGMIPDIGATIAFVETSTGRKPDVVIGKPNPHIVHALADRIGIPIEDIAMVGDRLYTDIALGKVGLMTVLVLSGETSPEDVPPSPYQPDLIVEDLAHLLDLLT